MRSLTNHARNAPSKPAAALFLIALGCSLLLACASADAAGVYGGLGPVGSTITSGTKGEHGQVSPEGQAHGHAFASDAETGEFFIADELKLVSEGKTVYYARLQAFSASGGFLAESRIKLKVREEAPDQRVGGLAVDPQLDKVYLLLDEERVEDKASVEKEIAKIESQITTTEVEIEKVKKKLAGASEPEKKKLEEELAGLKKKLAEQNAEQTALEAKEEALDPDDFAANALYSFSTSELKEQKQLVGGSGAESLESASEAPRVSLIDPAGIAVDPKTHDILILGQQNEAERPEDESHEEEQLRTAVQRVHDNGKFGPRYMDSADCLDEGDPVVGEPHCEDDEATTPDSPVVTSGGRLYAQLGEEIWEVPVSAEASKSYKEISEVLKSSITPRFLTELEAELPSAEPIVKAVEPEQEAGMLAFAPGKTGEGTIYFRAEFPSGTHNGVMLYHYLESGKSSAPEATEEGWTGGQENVSPQTRCIVPGSEAHQPLLAPGTGESVMMLSYEAGRVMKFGGGGEGCGHEPTVSLPSVEVAGHPHATEAGINDLVKFSSKVTNARAKTVKWTLVDTTTKRKEEVATPYAVSRTTVLEHKFPEAGTWEITENVETDSLAFPSKSAEPVKLLVSGVSLRLEPPETAVKAAEEISVGASFKDGQEETPMHVEAVWNYGDGTEVVEHHESSGTTVVFSGKHTYSSPGEKEVTLTVKDKDGVAKATVMISVGKSEAELLQEQHEAEQRQREAEAQQRQREAEAQQRQREAEAQQHQREKEEAEAAARKQHEKEVAEHGVAGYAAPVITVNGSAIKVSSGGAFTVKLSCPVHAGSCTGTIVVHTAGAVSAGPHRKKAVLTLASASFTIGEGAVKSLSLHLSAAGRSLLSRSHTVHASAAIAAHNAADASKASVAGITLTLAKGKH